MRGLGATPAPCSAAAGSWASGCCGRSPRAGAWKACLWEHPEHRRCAAWLLGTGSAALSYSRSKNEAASPTCAGRPRRCHPALWGRPLCPTSPAPSQWALPRRPSCTVNVAPAVVRIGAVARMLLAAVPCGVWWRKSVWGETAADSLSWRQGRPGRSLCPPLLPLMPGPMCQAAPSPPAPILVGQVADQRIQEQRRGLCQDQ